MDPIVAGAKTDYERLRAEIEAELKAAEAQYAKDRGWLWTWLGAHPFRTLLIGAGLEAVVAIIITLMVR